MSKSAAPMVGDEPQLSGLLDALHSLIHQGRQRALRAVDIVQVHTCWEIERHIVEFGKGFDPSNLRYVRLLDQAFPIRGALRHELSWTHCRHLLLVSDTTAR